MFNSYILFDCEGYALSDTLYRTEIELLVFNRGGGGHFHITSDMDVRQTQGVIFDPKICKGCLFSIKNLQRVSFSGYQGLKLL